MKRLSKSNFVPYVRPCYDHLNDILNVLGWRVDYADPKDDDCLFVISHVRVTPLLYLTSAAVIYLPVDFPFNDH